jgi:hypothetical protein
MTRRKVLIALAATAALLPACAGDVTRQPERRYKLHGTVVAVKTNMAHHLRIDGDEVRGEVGGGGGGRGGDGVFMQKMTMDWRVKPEENINNIQPGDEVNADVVAPGDGTAYLENVTVIKKAEPMPPPEAATPASK